MKEILILSKSMLSFYDRHSVKSLIPNLKLLIESNEASKIIRGWSSFPPFSGEPEGMTLVGLEGGGA